MNVLHLSYLDNRGGSARGAYRLHSALRSRGVGSQMIVRHKTTADPDVGLVTFGALEKLDSVAGKIADTFALESLFYPSSFALRRRPAFRRADILQLYNLHGGWFTPNALPMLSRARPIVWLLDDMAAFTGHCAYSFDCTGFLKGCGGCPQLDNPWPLRRDTTAFLWKMKNRAYALSRITVVAPSRWMEESARSSPLLGRFPVHRIPYGIDTALFRPMRRAAREVLGLPPDRLMVLFTAELVTQERKGVRYFIEAIERLSPEWRGKIMLLIPGHGSEQLKLPSGIEVKRFGMVGDDRLLAAIYAAADLTVLTTLADNLPNALLEAMACGTPAIALATGGVPDAVRHLETGWLAAPRSAEEITVGLVRLLADDALRERLGRRAREVAETEYGVQLQAARFTALYEEVMNER